MSSGPLAGVRVLELAGIGPAPFGAMLLADLGADVVRVAQPSHVKHRSDRLLAHDVLSRGKRSVAVDLKSAAGAEFVLELMAVADVLIDPFRPGVLERLGLAPETCLETNPRLVLARMTGWGQDGPLRGAAGHDINYIALAGALAAMGPADSKPTIPLNLVGDFGGGGMLLVCGVLAALLERATSGAGQVIDVAMIDGAALLMAMFFGMQDHPAYSGERGRNMLDGGAWFYDTYETSDGRYVAVGAIEPEFREVLLEKIGVSPTEVSQADAVSPADVEARTRDRDTLTTVFKSKTLVEWCELLEGTDACFAPVLPIGEVPNHPHNVARESFVEIAGVVQPRPAPRFSRTSCAVPRRAPHPGQDAASVLTDWLGLDDETVERHRLEGTVVGGGPS